MAETLKTASYELLDLNFYGDARGSLVSFEKGKNIPFDIKRTFYIFDTKGDVSRGCHANKHSKFLLVVINGSCRVKIDDGQKTDDVLLNNPHKALFLNNMVWKEMYEFSHNAVLLVLASEYYDEGEYIRNYDQFQKSIIANYKE